MLRKSFFESFFKLSIHNSLKIFSFLLIVNSLQGSSESLIVKPKINFSMQRVVRLISRSYKKKTDRRGNSKKILEYIRFSNLRVQKNDSIFRIGNKLHCIFQE